MRRTIGALGGEMGVSGMMIISDECAGTGERSAGSVLGHVGSSSSSLMIAAWIREELYESVKEDFSKGAPNKNNQTLNPEIYFLT